MNKQFLITSYIELVRIIDQDVNQTNVPKTFYRLDMIYDQEDRWGAVRQDILTILTHLTEEDIKNIKVEISKYA